MTSFLPGGQQIIGGPFIGRAIEILVVNKAHGRITAKPVDPQVAGNGVYPGHDRTLVRRVEDAGKFSVLYYRDNRVIAADCVNSPLDFMAVKAALAKSAAIPYDAAADPTTPLKSITVDA